MIVKKLPLIVLFLVACNFHTGNVDESCNPDGTCNSPNLECWSLSSRCHAKELRNTSARCSYESECFCVTCADKCGEAGVKTCAYSDTSVWGSKPAVCECK